MTNEATQPQEAAAVGESAVQCIVSNLIDGLVPRGESCFASDLCEFKEVACNGEGCPVSDGKTIHQRFSCALARSFELDC